MGPSSQGVAKEGANDMNPAPAACLALQEWDVGSPSLLKQPPRHNQPQGT